MSLGVPYNSINYLVEKRINHPKMIDETMGFVGFMLDNMMDLDLDNFPLLSEVNQLSTDKLLAKLNSLGVQLDQKQFEKIYKKFVSTEKMTHWIIKKYKLNLQNKTDEQWLWVCIYILWQRWFPDRINAEIIENLLTAGQDILMKEDVSYDERVKGVNQLFLAWERILAFMKQEKIKTFKKFDKITGNLVSTAKVIQNIDVELALLGFENPDYFHKKIDFAEQILKSPAKPDKTLKANLTGSIAHSTFELDEREKADSMFQKLIEENPGSGWLRFMWADCYIKHEEYSRAIEILNNALQLDDLEIKIEAAEILYDIYSEIGDKKNVKKMDKLLDSLGEMYDELDDKGLPSSNLLEALSDGLIEATKIGRNDPCYCGSGKKYKKCCGKAQ